MSGKTLLLIPVVALVVILASTAVFYGGVYRGPGYVPPSLDEVVEPIHQTRPFIDAPVVKNGLLVIDNAHWNSFDENEISVFLNRIASRGFNVSYTGAADNREDELEEKLRQAQAYAVILPWRPFSDREVQTVKNFVDRGGRLLLVGDATRSHRLNSVSSIFGINMEPDYLYNVKEHEIIFQNIYLKDFQADELTRGLEKVVLFAAGSISSQGKGLLLTDENTFSSARERTGRFAAAVRDYDGRVVAISDLSFMIPPYNALFDNDQLIANLADFVTQGERDYFLEDFPNFLGPEVPVIALHEDLIPVAQKLRANLSKTGRLVRMSNREVPGVDNIILGLWNDAGTLEFYLSGGGISVRDKVRTAVSPDISKKGTGLVFLSRTFERRVLVILGDDKDVLDAAISRLDNGQFRKDLVSPNLGIILSPPAKGGAAAK